MFDAPAARVPETRLPVVDRERRKRWLYVLPVIFITYSLAYLDRANYGLGAAAGLAATLHITGSQSALLGSLFFLGYFAFQVPGIAYARRHSSTRLVFAALICWGILAALTGVIRQFWLLAIDRLLLGVAESIVFPAMLVLITRWFTRSERSRANTLLMLGNPTTVLWMSLITGYLIQSVGWQKTFILEGLPAVVWAFVWLAVIRDKPSDAQWMSAEASAALERQLAEEQLALPRIGSLREALARKDVLVLCLLYLCWSLGVYGFVLWLPTIIRAGSRSGIGRTGLLSAVPYLLAVILMLVASSTSDRTLRRKAIVWPFLVVAGVALFTSFLFAQHSFYTAYAALILAGGAMYAPYGSFFALIAEVIPKTVLDEVLALINSSGALGGFAGAWLVGVLQARTGNARAGFLLMSGALIASGMLMLLIPAPGQRFRRPPFPSPSVRGDGGSA
jgi:sugar phosphate permease